MVHGLSNPLPLRPDLAIIHAVVERRLLIRAPSVAFIVVVAVEVVMLVFLLGQIDLVVAIPDGVLFHLIGVVDDEIIDPDVPLVQRENQARAVAGFVRVPCLEVKRFVPPVAPDGVAASLLQLVAVDVAAVAFTRDGVRELAVLVGRRGSAEEEKEKGGEQGSCDGTHFGSLAEGKNED
ncbi:uncharacterized protein J3D65DRAFT_608944 [Phyllosticta citribraziliensis]|uniref:Uncharacterized protein n=1 Tax=Phyllosticta citribraziliensis TaxID=989973 RepID=A0ABR1M8Q4_9PEZI